MGEFRTRLAPTLNPIARAARTDEIRGRIVDAARRWYRSGGNAEAELASLVQELEAVEAAS